jgi:hypothetical protein
MTHRSFRTRIPAFALFTWLAACQAVGTDSSGEGRRGHLLEFDRLQVGSVYGIGASFESDGLDFAVEDFGGALGNVEVAHASSGVETSTVPASTKAVAKESSRDEAARSIRLAHVQLRCSDSDAEYLEFDYVDRGGPVALGIDGVTRSVADFVELDGQEVGGAKLAVRESSTAGVRHGRVTVAGRIERFSIAGADLELSGLRID